jgi:Caspase domain
MLKVIYDAANDMEGAAQTEAAAQALFEDDDEETDDDDAPSFSAKSFKSGDSLDFATQTLTQSNLTWASLLRQMKPEFKDVGYAQVPKITTTRKFDLNQPFSLTSDKFDPKKHKKRALLIGCNYKNLSGAELKASHDDVRSIKDFIVNVHGFSEKPEFMTVLLDEDNHTPPTYHNIIDSFKQLSEQAQPGDAVFVQFSGHGGRVLDAVVDAQVESYDEIIVPMDYEDHGVIRDTLIFKTLLAPMRYGVTLTVMIDCCDTGMVMELPYSWTTRGDKKDSIAKVSR